MIPKDTGVLLKEFYQAYLAWVKSGAVDTTIFIREAGLCGNLMSYVRAKQACWLKAGEVLDAMTAQFKDAGLNPKLPFDGTPEHYDRASESKILHTNPARIKWVKEHAK